MTKPTYVANLERLGFNVIAVSPEVNRSLILQGHLNGIRQQLGIPEKAQQLEPDLNAFKDQADYLLTWVSTLPSEQQQAYKKLKASIKRLLP